MDTRPPLSRQDVRSMIEFGGGCDHIPMTYHYWCHHRFDGTPEWNEKVAATNAKYPFDVLTIGIGQPGMWDAPPDAPRQRWSHKDKPATPAAGAALDGGSKVIADLSAEIDDFLADFPDPNYAPYYDGLEKAVKEDKNGRYRMASMFFCYFERLWTFMGMEQTLVNFYTCPDAMHKLIDALCEYRVAAIRNSAARCELDGYCVSDDIGQQTGTFFSLEIFNEFFKPAYKRLVDECHRHNMHFWLHTCGNIEAFMPGFIEIGLDVIHPIQKYTMDEAKIARQYGDKICFWAGFDVQQILPYGTPEDVRREVRFMIDTYARPGGGLILTAGNGVTPDNPPENIEALYEESMRYGSNYRERLKARV